MSASLGFKEKRDQILGIFDKMFSFIKQYGFDIDKKILEETKGKKGLLEEAKEKLEKGTLEVVVCGEMKRGKSSLLGALLGEKGLFPVDMMPATNLVTVCSYGAEETITVYIAGEKGGVKKITRNEIAEYVTEQGNKGNQKDAELITAEINNELLKDGVVFVDTPGVGSMNAAHSAVTNAYIPNADVILFVCDTMSPLKDTELAFIRRIHDKFGKDNFVFVMTKIDDKQGYQELLEDNRKAIAEVLGCAATEVAICPVSSYLKLQYLETKQPIALKGSNFPQLEETLWKFLSERKGRILLMPALLKLKDEMTRIIQHIEAEMDALNHDDKIKKLEENLQQAIKRTEHLKEDNADWITQLNDGANDLRRDIFHDLEEGINQLYETANDYASDPDYQGDPNSALARLKNDMEDLIQELNQVIETNASDLASGIEERAEIHFSPFPPLRIEIDADMPRLPDQSKTGRFFDKARVATRYATFNSTSGAVIGGLIGGIICSIIPGVGTAVGAGLGAMIGGGWGAYKGAQDGLITCKATDKNKMLNIMNKYISECSRHLRRELDNHITYLQRQIRDDFTYEIKRKSEEYQETRASIQQALNMSKEQASKRKETLRAPKATADRLYAEIMSLAAAEMDGIDKNNNSTIRRSAVKLDWADM